jgi:hypothetical protein
MNEFMAAIEAALKAHPLSQQLLQFLIDHEGAMDTIDGVAKCWVNSDPVAVKSVLDSLQGVGVVATEVLSSGTYYRLTTNAEIRTWLKTHYARNGAAQRALASASERTPRNN